MIPAVLAVVSALAAQPAAAASTDALKLACGGDAMRLCAASIPQGIPAIKSCMQAHWASVSATCKTVAENKGEPLKVAPPSKVITPKHLPKINLRPVLSGSSSQGVSQPPIITSKTQERPMDWADYVVKAFAVFGAGYVAYYTLRYGVGAVATKMASWVTVAKSDFSALEARVVGLESAVGIASPTGPTGSAPPKAVPAKPAAPVANTATPAA